MTADGSTDGPVSSPSVFHKIPMTMTPIWLILWFQQKELLWRLLLLCYAVLVRITAAAVVVITAAFTVDYCHSGSGFQMVVSPPQVHMPQSFNIYLK